MMGCCILGALVGAVRCKVGGWPGGGVLEVFRWRVEWLATVWFGGAWEDDAWLLLRLGGVVQQQWRRWG